MTQTDSDQSLPTDNTGLCHGDIHMAKEWQLYLVGAGTKPFSMLMSHSLILALLYSQ